MSTNENSINDSIESESESCTSYQPLAKIASPFDRIKSNVIDVIWFICLGMIISIAGVFNSFSADPAINNGSISDSMMSNQEVVSRLYGYMNDSFTFGFASLILIFLGRAVFSSGQTFGRSHEDMYIVSRSGKRATIIQLLVRFIAKVFTVYLGLGVGLVFMIILPGNRAFHDLISGTYVVKLDKPNLENFTDKSLYFENIVQK